MQEPVLLLLAEQQRHWHTALTMHAHQSAPAATLQPGAPAAQCLQRIGCGALLPEVSAAYSAGPSRGLQTPSAVHGGGGVHALTAAAQDMSQWHSAAVCFSCYSLQRG